MTTVPAEPTDAHPFDMTQEPTEPAEPAALAEPAEPAALVEPAALAEFAETDTVDGWDPPEVGAHPGSLMARAPYRVPGTTPAPRPEGWFSSTSAASMAASAPARLTYTGTPPAQMAKAGLLSDLPFRAPADISGWILAIGSGLAAISFLLPWAQVGVSGTQLEPGYFGRWGLANLSYLFLVGAAVAVLLITTIPNRLPATARTIALPLVLGGALLGLGWSYATGTYGSGPGVDAMSLGAVLMVVAGALELRPSRLARLAPPTTEGTSSGTDIPAP